ncbi:hypothetical protein PINS_up003046 [Pythium insidiosum]|nr:hypothetical protein PINS_up003046 [Pythium insidiosum]
MATGGLYVTTLGGGSAGGAAQSAAMLLPQDRRVHLIDDLLGAILLLAAAALAVLLDLTRRRICALYQLAFVLYAVCAFFVVGGLVDHHLSDDQLHLALYTSYLASSSLTTFVYVPIATSAAAALFVVLPLTRCACSCCCCPLLVPSDHQRCAIFRIRALSSMYATCLLLLYLVIGVRLNVRLRESAINPVGGTVHWMMLRSPFYLSMAHLGSLALIVLKRFLQHQHMDLSPSGSPSPPSFASSSISTAVPSTVEELMRPPLSKALPLASGRRSASDLKVSRPRSPQSTESDTRASPTAITRLARSRSTASALVDDLPQRQRRLSDNNNQPSNEGDVSALISSDSDSDDGVLQPNFQRSARSTLSAKLTTLHGTAAMNAKRPSTPSSTRSSLSPPPSPTPSTSSTGSTSSFSSSSRPRAAPATRGASPFALRPRLSSGDSFASSTLSDSELSAVAMLGDDRATAQLRRRAPQRRPVGELSLPLATTAIASHASGTYSNSDAWIECVDDRTGALYLYNALTGESRWKNTT